MATKSETLMGRIGSGLAETIGIRPGQSAKPTYTSGADTPKADFVRSRQVGDIHPKEVMPDPNQPRKHFDEEEIDRLAADLQKRGQLQPIRVRWSQEHGKWLIIAGERRWRASTKAGLQKITCVFIDKELSENEIRSEQLVENLLREDLNGLELAKSFSALMELNRWSATQLAENLSISKGKVSKALSLLKLPEELQAKIEAGELSPSTAYELSKAKTDEERDRLAELAANGQVTQEDAAKATRKKSTEQKRRSTNETFRTSDNVRVTIVARRDIGEAGMVQSLLEAIESIRGRGKTAVKKVA